MKNKKTSDTVLLINTASEVVLFALYILQGFAEQSIRQVAEQSKTELALRGINRFHSCFFVAKAKILW